MDQHEIVSPVPFMLLLETLKHLPRTGWVQHGVDCPESVSGHIFLMTVMASLLKSDGDPSRRAAMALVHDMAESLVGDITPSQGVSKEEKHQRELLAMKYIQIEAAKSNSAFADQTMEL
ncbi:uncharacterized protein L3040_002102 [Drepanopeziza brunnea f. sp. 'multigermtubi']|uniref:uncharacterized protein n=1 Tax=Drepanopeziza brunnea f. sp. 'multigermtubi' TaxID=698441 RepID=UPI00239A2313|nr:hypothetical protein L3040_002102 [Drepanopeziza brunnea f. sp. 'multigermtubi']